MEEKVKPLANSFESLYDFGFHTEILNSDMPRNERAKFTTDFAIANVIYQEARSHIGITESMAMVLGKSVLIKEILQRKNGSDVYKILKRLRDFEEEKFPSDRLSHLSMVINVCENELKRIKEEEKQEQPELGM